MGRNIYPGLAPYRVNNGNQNWPPQEIVDQIEATRARYPSASGHIHFSMKTLMNEKNGVAKVLREGPYAEASLVPPSKWLDNQPPPRPNVNTAANSIHAAELGRDTVHFYWTSRAKGPERWLWAIYIRRGEKWTMQIEPGDVEHLDINVDSASINAIAVSGIDRAGNESPRRVVKIR